MWYRSWGQVRMASSGPYSPINPTQRVGGASGAADWDATGSGGTSGEQAETQTPEATSSTSR